MTDLLQVTDQEIELLRRSAIREKAKRTIRKSFRDWCVYSHPHEQPAKHHDLLIEHLQNLSTRKLIHPKTGNPCRKMIILMPPGSAKSTYTSIDFPPWYLNPDQHPENRILACSCTGTLAEKFSYGCRASIETEHDVLGYSLAKDSRAVSEWSTTIGGTYFCSGVGAAISGRRAYFGLIDDYIGSEEDADSKPLRDKQYNWYHNDFWTRLTPTAPVGIVANRRHWDDLVGRLLEEEEDEWLVIKLPYFAKEADPLGRRVGDRLWPEYFNEEHAKAVKKKPARTLAGLYQQDPHPEGGDYFKSDWLIGYKAGGLPKALNLYCASDHACSKRRDSDSNLLVPFGMDEGGNIWILDTFWWESGKTTGETVKAMLSLMEKYQPKFWIAESEHIVKSIGPFLREKMREQGLYSTRIEELSGNKDKGAKARSIQGRMEFHQVFFPKYHPRWSEIEHELLSFTGASNDVHDEWPDVLGVIGRFLDTMQKAVPEVQKEPETKQFSLKWLKEQRRVVEVEEQVALDN